MLDLMWLLLRTLFEWMVATCLFLMREHNQDFSEFIILNFIVIYFKTVFF